MADEEVQRLKQLEAVREKAELEAAQRAEREKSLTAEIETLQAEDPRLTQLEADLERAQTEIAQHAEREKQLEAEIESLRQAAAMQANSGFAEVADDTFELVDTKSITLSDVEPEPQDAWLKIDLHHSKPPVTANTNPETTGSLLNLEPIYPGASMGSPIGQRQSRNIPGDIAERLQSSDSSQRAAALVDLADCGGEEAFELISNSFDDPSVEIRNAAARALYSVQSDIAATFTRALREAVPERRRRIGSAIAGSGLAANAINSLAGEGRSRTYDAFSILFLMAKAGETQPLMTAIAKHSNLDVRLTAVKLIGLSNQQQVLPALRHMVSREQLPEEVADAIMEAIYLLSNQKHEVA
jgi:hypothetical protein